MKWFATGLIGASLIWIILTFIYTKNVVDFGWGVFLTTIFWCGIISYLFINKNKNVSKDLK